MSQTPLVLDLRLLRRVFPATAAALVLACSSGGPSGEARVTGQCADTLDNDGNGTIDCQDPNCAGYDGCPGGTGTSTGTSTGTNSGGDGAGGGRPIVVAGGGTTAVTVQGGSGGAPPVGVGGAGGASVTEPMLDDCAGISLVSDGVLDVDLRAIQIAGNVTLAGATLPDELDVRGRVAFVDAQQGAHASYPLESTGEASYTLTLPPGTYDVVFEPNPNLCTLDALPEMPCGGGTLLTSVPLSADGVLDVDIPVASVSGTVTLDGQLFLDDRAERGWLEFRGEDGSVATKPFGASGAVGYSVTLFPGTYDVAFVGNPELCASSEASNAPCNSGVVVAGASLTADGLLDVDVPAVTVAGNVTLAGATLPDEAASRGSITFVGENLAPAASLGFGSVGPATYAMTVLPGTYDVHFAGNPEMCTWETASSVPCNGGPVVSGASLVANGVLDVDLTAVSVSGNVTLNGAEFPSEAAQRGWLALSRVDGARALTDTFGLVGAVSYEMTVLAGTYDVVYVPNPALCTPESVPQAPCNGATLIREMSLATSGVVDVDVPAVSIAGNVTVNGAPMQSEAADRGTLLFSLDGGGAVALPSFDLGGAYDYGLSLIPGIYTVSLAANPALCNGENNPAIPCISGTLLPSVELRADGALDVDVPAIQLSGSVTLEGQPLPEELRSRGGIRFFLLGDDTSAVGGDLTSSGEGTYRITLLPGSYTTSHQASPALCGVDQPAPDIPCASQLLLGCD